jgi:hypothetical protein
MKKKQPKKALSKTKQPIDIVVSGADVLYERIASVIRGARATIIMRSVDNTMVKAYCGI